jgi:hypothetical protein
VPRRNGWEFNFRLANLPGCSPPYKGMTKTLSSLLILAAISGVGAIPAAHAQTEVTPGMENPCVANFGYQGCTPGGMPKPPGGPVDHHAVVAISPTTMDWGSAHAGTSLSDDEQTAIQACRGATGATDCKWTASAMNECVALAVNYASKTYGYSWGGSREETAATALDMCRKQGGKSCVTVSAPCASDDIRWWAPLPLPPAPAGKAVTLDPQLVGMWTLAIYTKMSINPGLWFLGDKLPDGLCLSRPHCGEDIVPCSMCQQKLDDLGARGRISRYSCPADDAKLERIAFANGIRPVLDQETNDRKEQLFGGKVQRVSVVSRAADVRIGAALEQKLHSRFTPSRNSMMQSGSYICPSGFIDKSRIRGEQGVESREIASARGILESSKLGLDGRRGRLLRKHMGLQRWPGFESIFVGNDKLRIGERELSPAKKKIGSVLPARVVCADARKNLRNRCAMTFEKSLGLIPELFEIRARRELLLHGNLLSLGACVRIAG